MHKLPKKWLVPVCEEAIEMLNYFNPEASFMLQIMYADDDGKIKPMYDHIGVLEGDIYPWAVKPPMCDLLTIDDFRKKIYLPFVFDFDLP
jgi:hypothetical protein